MKLLIELFREQVAAHPSSIAVEDGTVPGVSKQVTYQELDELSDNFSFQLRQHGVRRGDIVPVLSTRCIGAIVAVLAIHKLRACYVPIDLDTWGNDRIESTLDRVKAKLVVTTNPDAFTGTGEEKQVMHIPHDGRLPANPPTPPDSPREEDPPEPSPEDWAYVIFTSGSTGRPKGVIVNQRSITALVTEKNSLPFNLHAGADSRVLLIFSFAFDACTYVLTAALTSGATLVLASPATLAAVAQTCTIWIATPSILAAMDAGARDYSKTSLIMMGGEHPPPSVVDAWSAPGRRLINIYGPTEATCTVLMAEMRPGEPVVMGKPISFCRVLLVDDGGREVGEGEDAEGEMWLGGPGVAVGYYDDSALTRGAFVERDGERFYRTRDYARRSPAGLVFCGRKDAVVKNRGFLVNLESEVEPAMLRAGNDDDNAVTAIKHAAAVSHRGALVGFVAPAAAAEGLRARMLADPSLSAFLVPDVVHGLAAFPSTSNGKVDRKALAALHERTELPEFITPELFLQGVRDAGRELTAVEAVRHAVCMVLRVVQARVDDEASFRALGGHSLAAVMLVSTLRRLGWRTDVAEVFRLDTVGRIAGAARKIEGERPVGGHDDGRFDDDRRRFEEEIGATAAAADGIAGVAPATDIQVRMVRGTVDDPALNFIKIGLSFDHGADATFPEALREAWRRLSRRHSILRSSFHLPSSEPLQLLHEEVEVLWQEDVVSSEEAWRATCDVSGQIEPEEFTSFDEQDCNVLSRVRVVILPGVRCRLIWTVHHSLVDGWSASVIFNDLWELLHARDLPPCPQFSDAAWCMRRLIQRDSQAAKAFWQDQLGDLENIPRLRVPPPEDATSKRLSERRRRLSIKLTELEAAAKEYGVTTAAIVYGAWAVVLSRYCDSQKVVLGTVLSGRSLPLAGVEQVVGPLVNSLPMPVMLQEDATVPEFLRQVFKSMCQLLDFQWAPNSLVQEATGRKGTDYFDTLLAIQYDFPAQQWSNGRFAAPYDISIAETTEMPLSVMVDAVEGCLDARFVFRPSNFGEPMVERMINHFENILRSLIEPSMQRSEAASSVGEVATRMLSEEEAHASLNCSEYIDEPYEGPETLADAFELSLSEYPSYVAVEGLDRSLTYSELDSETAQVTRILLQRGVKAGDIVCIIADGSVNWLLAIMSVVRTGAAYCPIDSKFPAERQKYMMSLCHPPIILYPSAALRQEHSGHEGALQLDVETILADGMSESDGSSSDGWELAPKSQAAANDLAVILFTSGTTGFPKAVQLEHKPILSVLSWAPTRLRSKPGQRNAQLLSLGFDCCVTEVFSSLLYGATLVLKDAADPLAHLSKVDAIVATPSLVTNLDPADYPNLKVVTLMGEPLPAALARRWMAPGRVLQNSYGPAETTLMTNAHPLGPDAPISVGKPIPRVAFYILDAAGRPVPTGVTGEIFVASGLQVTRGYRNNPDETAFRFLPDPFRPGWKMFRSGDMGRWDEDGHTQIVGRVDSQVKLRGFRIDLGDIEATMARVAPTVDNVAVVVTGGGTQLRAFVTPESVDARALMATLRAHLPEYSTPAAITPLPALPLSPNGKVNRKELAAMQHLRREGEDAVLEPLRTDTERAVADVWAELLGRGDGQPIGALDRFFDLGGHSLLQIRLAQKLSALWNARVPLRTVIRHQVLRELCAALDEHLASVQSSSCNARRRVPFAEMRRVPRGEGEKTPASYLEREMVLNQMLAGAGGSPAWNIVYACTAYGAVDVGALHAAFRATVARNEVLRSRFHNDDGVIMRSVREDLSPFSPSHVECVSEGDVDAFVSRKIQRPLDPFADGLVQMHTATVAAAPWKTVVVFVMSHVVGDGPTLYGVLRETSAAYTRITGGGSSEDDDGQPGGGALSYLDWARWTADDDDNNANTTAIDPETATFWRTALASARRRPALPRARRDDDATPSSATFRGALSAWTVRPSLRRRLARLAVAHGLSMHQLALAATWVALRAVRQPEEDPEPSSSSPSTKKHVVTLGAPMTLRTEPGTEGMPGLFLDRVVVPLPWGGVEGGDDGKDDSLPALLATVRENSDAARAHFVPHRALRRLLMSSDGANNENENDRVLPASAAPSLSAPLVDVVVAFHTAAEAAERRRGFALVRGGNGTSTTEGGTELRQPAPAPASAVVDILPIPDRQRPRGVAKFPVMVEFTDDGNGDDDGELRVELEWDGGVVGADLAERLEGALVGALEAMGCASSAASSSAAASCGANVSVSGLVDALRRRGCGGSSLGRGAAAHNSGGGQLPTTPGEEKKEEIAVRLDGAPVGSAGEVDAARAERVVRIREAMAECLGLERKDIGCMRSFWDLGAESMDAVRLLDACERKGLRLGLRNIFDSPTADALAGLCRVDV